MITVETMALEGVKHLLQWAAAEGWNPGLDDANAFYSADPEGFLMVKDANKTVAGISVIRQDDQNGFLGLYLCHPDYRGRGYGWKAWQAAMQYLKGRTIGLDGVPEQQDNYRKSGFKYHYRNIRFSGEAVGLLNDSEIINISHQQKCTVEYVKSTDMNALHQLDARVHGLSRYEFLKGWLNNTDSRITLLCKSNETLMGFGTIRACQQGYKIGPLIANDSDIARLLVSALANGLKAKELIIDIPEPNAEAARITEELGLKPVFDTARMYRGDAPEYQLQLLYGVTTFELG